MIPFDIPEIGNTVRRRYNTGKFPQNIHNGYPVSNLWGRGMGFLLTYVYTLWLIFQIGRRSAA